MKDDIHPEYKEATVVCGCGNSFTTRSTRDKIAIEVCSACHPFYTGKQKFLDTAGMVEKFQRRWQGDAAQKAKSAGVKPARKVHVRPQLGRIQQTISAQFGAPVAAAAPAPAATPPPTPPAPSKNT